VGVSRCHVVRGDRRSRSGSANAGRITDWCKQYHEAVHPFSAGAAYVNFMMDEGQERVRATYGENYGAAGADQGGVRSRQPVPLNQNIKPAR